MTVHRLTDLYVEQVSHNESHRRSQVAPSYVLHPVYGRALQAEGEAFPDAGEGFGQTSPHAAVGSLGDVVRPGEERGRDVGGVEDVWWWLWS